MNPPQGVTPRFAATDATICDDVRSRSGYALGVPLSFDLLVVTIPAQDEAATIRQVVSQIPRKIPHVGRVEVIVVDDASTDATAKEARAAGADVVPMIGRPGLGPVWRLGMEQAIRRGADLIVNLDGDGQFNSEDVAGIIQPILDGQADFVACTRFANGGPVGHMPFIKRWGNSLVTWLTNRVCETKFTDVSCGFRAYNRESAYRLLQFGRWTYTEECIVYLVNRGLRMVQLPFAVRGEREFGKSRVASNVVYFASHLLHILARAVRDANPLKFFGWMAAAALVPGLLMLVFLSIWYLATGALVPFAQVLTLGAAITLIGVLLLALALLADMVSRHRVIHEDLLYLARRRYYGRGRTVDAPDEAALASVFEA